MDYKDGATLMLGLSSLIGRLTLSSYCVLGISLLLFYFQIPTNNLKQWRESITSFKIKKCADHIFVIGCIFQLLSIRFKICSGHDLYGLKPALYSPLLVFNKLLLRSIK